MASPVTIANRALVLLGADAITSLDDQTTPARACKSEYDNCRLAELQATNWSFAIKRALLAASATPPGWGFTLSYPYPTDCLRVVQVADYFVGLTLTHYRSRDEVEYSLEGRQILTNLGAPLQLKYVYDAGDATQFAPLFVDAVAHRLAWTICKVITQSDSTVQSLRSDYAIVIQEAIRANAVERPPVALPDDSWIISRL